MSNAAIAIRRRAAAAADSAKALQDASRRKLARFFPGASAAAIALVEESALAGTVEQEARCDEQAAHLVETHYKAAKANAEVLAAAVRLDLQDLTDDARTAVLKLAAARRVEALDSLIRRGESQVQRAVLSQLSGAALKTARRELLAILAESPRLPDDSERKSLQATVVQSVRDQVVLQTGRYVNGLQAMASDVEDAARFMRQYYHATDALDGAAAAVTTWVEGQAQQKLAEMPAAQRAAMTTVVSLAERFQRGGSISADAMGDALAAAGLPNAKQVRKALSDLAVVGKPQTFAQGLAGVQGYVGLVTSLGVDVPPRLDRALGKASTAVGVVVAFQTGNFFGAFAGASSLFGGKGVAGVGGRSGGGPDPAIMAKLDEILKLQRQTIEKLDNLSEKLAKAEARIVGKLDRLDELLVHLLGLQKDVTYSSPLTNCAGAYKTALDAGWSVHTRAFSNYEQRRKHYETVRADALDGFGECVTLTGNVLKLHAGDESVPELLLAVTPRNQMRDDPNSTLLHRLRTHYEPMLEWTAHLLGIYEAKRFNDRKMDTTAAPELALSARCAQRLLGALSLAPLTLNAARDVPLKCDEGDGPRMALVGSGVAGEPNHPAELLRVFINASQVAVLTEYLLFVQSYEPYQPAVEAKQLISPERVRAPGFPDGQRLYRQSLLNATDVVQVTLAQQALLSGVYLLPALHKVLVDTQFGRNRPQPSLPRVSKGKPAPKPADFAYGPPQPPMANAKPNKDDDYLKGCNVRYMVADYPYEVAVCMLSRHPTVAHNLMTYIMLADLAQSVDPGGWRPSQLKDLLNDGVSDPVQGRPRSQDIRRLLPTFGEFVKPGVDGIWRLELPAEFLPSQDKVLRLPLATTQELVERAAAYPEVTNVLRRLRQDLLVESDGNGGVLLNQAQARDWAEVRLSIPSMLPPPFDPSALPLPKR